MLRFIKTFWIALLATAAMFTSCVRIDAGPTPGQALRHQTTLNLPAPGLPQ